MPAATKAECVEGGGVVGEGGVVGGGVVGEGECGGIVRQLEASGLGRERHDQPCLKVPRELLRSFPHSKRVGSYLVGKMINKGSFAKVMEGLHISTGEKVAIKVIDKKKARQDSYVLKNMKREPGIHQMVRHPHIVVLLETLETENSYYMVMELCAGGDLMDRICEKKRLEEREVRRYTRQILSAVEHLHTHGIIHRDLKIENFLLDEHNNIKIVDFGLSNTLKVQRESAELLNTQCGSPAYAAPELLAHSKYGPKVDVWSVGVSVFAMLTGTLPFTVEPFNIKQLHQKMVNREIGTIPNDISKGAVGFVLSLLEPEPSKRPTIRTAMEEKWINEGNNKTHLHTHRNRLRPEDLNQSVLSYMTESLGYSLSDVISMLTNNRPSAVLASYHLLLSKVTRGQRGARCIKKLDTSEWNLPNKTTWREKSIPAARTQQQTDPANEKVSKQSSRPPRSQPQPTEEECLGNKKRQEDPSTEPRPSSTSLPPFPPSPSPSPSPTPLIDEEIAITVFPEVSVFGDRELVHLAPPKSSAFKLCDSAPLPRLLDPTRDGQCPPPVSNNDRLKKLQTFYSSETKGGVSISPRMILETTEPRPSDRQHLVRPVRPLHALRTTHSDGAELNNSHLHNDDNGCHDDHVHHHRHGNNDRLKKLQTFYSSETKGGVSISPRMILETTEPRPSDREHLAGTMEMSQTAPPPLPQLRNAGLKDGRGGRKVTWVGHMVRPQGPTGLLVNGSKPPAFPSQRQHAVVIKSLRQERGRRGGGREGGGGRVEGGGVKRNSVQLRQSLQHRVADLNLPLLPAPPQRPY